MAVHKSVNIAGSGPTFEEAVQEAMDRAYATLEAFTGFEVTAISGELTDAGIVFDVQLISGSRFWSGCTSEASPVSEHHSDASRSDLARRHRGGRDAHRGQPHRHCQRLPR